jgi:hypothetical protein
LVGLFRQSVFGRLAGYEDVNDAERLRHDPAMRWIVGGKAAQGCAASPRASGLDVPHEDSVIWSAPARLRDAQILPIDYRHDRPDGD